MLRFGLLLCVVGLAVAGPSVTRTREEIEEYRQFLEKSRTGDGVRIDSRMLQNPQGNIWENSGKFEGDVILDDWQVDALVTDFAAGRAAYIWPNTKWPNNVVIWEWGNNEFNAAQQRHILDAMGWIEHFSCIRFRRRTFERDYVLLTGRSDGCYANVGFWAGRGVHILNLARSNPNTGCLWTTVIIHEWLHILGFFHMQSTYNRDNYVRINWQNIQSGMGHNFDRYESNVVSNLALPYEYTSSMHYSTHAFSFNGQPTIDALRPFNGVMGHMDYVTYYDWLRLRRHYNCPGGWSEEDILQLKNEVALYSGQEAEETPKVIETETAEDAKIVEENVKLADAEIPLETGEEIWQ